MPFVVDINAIKNEVLVWVSYNDTVKFRVKVPTTSDFMRLRKMSTVSGQVEIAGKTALVETLDKDLLEKNTFRETIREWEGFEDPEGNPIPVTNDNIDAVMNYFVVTAMWLDKKLMDLAEAMAEKKSAPKPT